MSELSERASRGARRAAGSRGRPRRARAAPVAAERLPVARVAVDVSLPHLDRPFDYLVPERMADTARPGCRVRVRFAGQLTGGYLLSREAASEHPGRLAFLERVVSPEPVLTAEIAGLARAVADRYAGTLADVLRLAIPPRHAAAEAAEAAAKLARGPRPAAIQADGPAGAAREPRPAASRPTGQQGPPASPARPSRPTGQQGPPATPPGGSQGRRRRPRPALLPALALRSEPALCPRPSS